MAVGNGEGFGMVTASADLSSSQFRAVAPSGDLTVNAAGAGEFASGILQNAPASGEAALVWDRGVSKAEIGAAVAVNAQLTPDASGKLVTTSATDDYIVARALEAGAADGDIITVQITLEGQRQTT